MNKFLKEFKDRGFFYQCTNETELSDLMNDNKIKAYIGFDCTAESLHVGSLLQIMCLRLLQKHGHRPIVLLGGGTTRIGDPSGKDKTRTILSEEEIEKNIKSIENILKNFLDIKDPKTKPIFVNNYKWLEKLNYITTVWDLCHRDSPEFPEVYANRIFEQREFIYKKTLIKAVAIIADSELGKSNIIRRYLVDVSRIYVLPFSPALSVVNSDQIDCSTITEKFGIKKYQTYKDFAKKVLMIKMQSSKE